MKIYVGHSKELDFKKELYEPLRKSSLNSKHEIILPHEVYGEAIEFPTQDIIKICDLMIAEVSFPATGLGIELGWASAYDRKIICIYRKGSKISGSLKVICKNLIEYKNEKDIIDQLGELLSVT